jgi:succinate dehydrogenase / fumarate reductase cytochrome b subunit
MSDDRTGFALPPGRLEPVKLDLESANLPKRFTASVGKKYMMAIAGIVWTLFVIAHLLGNFGIYAGADAYNAYSAKLMSLGPILIALEAGLVFFLLLHVILAIVVQAGNWKARPEKYEVYRSKGGMTVASRTMIWTGAAILVFIVFHLLNLKFGEHGTDAEGRVDLFTSTVALLADPIKGISYLIAVCLVGLHVSHALMSAFRTFGLNHDRYTPTITTISWLLGIFVAVGYGSIPVWAMMGGGQ